MKKNNDDFPPASEKINEDINDKIDSILNDSPSETRKVVENLTFLEKIQKKNIPKGKHVLESFGVETFDLHDIFKDNLWDRSIFVTDAIVNMCVETSIEKMRKYLPKKTKMGFQYWWLIILLAVGIVGVLLIIAFLLPSLGNIKIF